MRLDHLLSREKCEGEEPEHDPRSRVERVERFSELTRKRREADRRGEEPKKKMPATSQPFLSIPSLYRFEGLPDNGKTSSLLSCQRDGRRPHLENCTGKESKQTLRRVAVKPSKKF